MMRSLGFAPRILQLLFLGETVTLSVCGWLFGTFAAYGLVFALVRSRTAGNFAVLLKIPLTTLALSLSVAGLVAVMSTAVPAYCGARINIVQGLRHIGSVRGSLRIEVAHTAIPRMTLRERGSDGSPLCHDVRRLSYSIAAEFPPYVSGR